MSICNVKIILGRLPDKIVGQWIEVRITLDGNPGFELQADICRLLGNGVFSLESILQKVEEPFTAELALALVAIIAEPPFAPTQIGLVIEVSGDPELANGEIGRFAFPEVRQDALELLLPLPLRESMLKKLRDAYKKRSLREYVSSELLQAPSRPVNAAMRLVIGGSQSEILDPDADRLREAMITARDAVLDRFVILARDGQIFMQCLCTPSGWKLEKREGDADHHYRALIYSDDPSEDVSTMDPVLRQLFKPSLAAGTFLGFDEVFEAMKSYLAFAPEPVWLGWEKYEI
jgi:hypothetical protein